MSSRENQISTTVSRTPSPIAELEEAYATLKRRAIVENSVPVAFRTGCSPSVEETTAMRAAVDRARRVLQSRLTVDDESREIEKALRLLLGSMKVSSELGVKGVVEAYPIALDDASSFALSLAVTRLLQGKAPEGFSKTFAPSAPELRAYVDQIEKNGLACASLTERFLALPEETPRPVLTEEPMAANRARIAEMFRDRTQA